MAKNRFIDIIPNSIVFFVSHYNYNNVFHTETETFRVGISHEKALNIHVWKKFGRSSFGWEV